MTITALESQIDAMMTDADLEEDRIELNSTKLCYYQTAVGEMMTDRAGQFDPPYTDELYAHALAYIVAKVG
jgi:hypothetical protein